MWCKNCNIETNEKNCPLCKAETVEDKPNEIFWCENCNTPILVEVNQPGKDTCPLCRKKMKYLASDLRPVFPEERLLVALLLRKEPDIFLEKSVWASKNRYYVNGKTITIPSRVYQNADTENLAEQIKEKQSLLTYEFFNQNISKFVEANKTRINYLIDEAHNFIKRTSEKFQEENIILSFSGGKDSTVVADLAIKALSNPSLVHIFGDTTLEFPYTTDYAKRYREEHPQAIFQIAKNKEQVFYDVCSDIGPPARMMRWCCFMFKTGPITRVINNYYRNQKVLTFYGIRKAESVARSKYKQVEDDPSSIKIQQQTVASPIFFWSDFDVWLYILSEKIDFNDAYRLGYDRVGCWCCPNNNFRSQFLSQIYMTKQAKKWRDFLIGFAKRVGKPDPENYVDSGKWKARQGGNGLPAANDVKIRFTNCTTENHAKIYKLVKPFSDDLINMFVPFGKIAPELGQKLLNEVIVLDVRTNTPILSIQPFRQDGYEYAVKIRTMNVADHNALQRMVSYQIRKYNACRKCLKCESLCKAGAITINSLGYFINPDKCIHCKMCVTAKYLHGGCLMDKFLRTK